MTQSLSINGKEYIQSNVLSAKVGYSSDYIGKLAREEKILGTQIGRQWFVEPNSLDSYLLQTKVHKTLRTEELKRKRKLEHAVHQKIAQVPQRAPHAELLALSQTVAIVLCGLLAGTIGWTFVSEDLSVSELALGAKESSAFIAQAILPFVFLEPAEGVYVAATVKSIPLENERFAAPLTFARLPQFPQRETTTTTDAAISGRFSDEVAVVMGADGKEYIEPIFKSGTSSVTFLLVPVNAEQN